MKARHTKLLHLLMSKGGEYQSGKILAENLGVSPRTIRQDVRYLNEEYLIDSIIVSNTRAGYKISGSLEGVQEQGYYEFTKRASYICRRLMEHEAWVTSEELAEEMLVSSQTIQADVHRLEELISKRGLKVSIETQPFLGIKLVGSEMNRRLLLAASMERDYTSSVDVVNEYAGLFEEWFSETEVEHISIRMDECLFHFEIDLDLEKWSALLAVCLMSIHRSPLTPINECEIASNLTEFEESRVAKAIVRAISDELTLPYTEYQWIALHIIGLKVMSHPVPVVQSQAQMELFVHLHHALDIVGNQYGYRLLADPSLIKGLQLHLGKAIYTLTYQVAIHNRLLSQIKEQYIQAYQMAVVLAELLGKSMRLTIPEAEVGFLALHLQVAIDRTNEEPIQVAIVHSGSQIVANLMKQKLEQSIRKVHVRGIFSIQNAGDIPDEVSTVVSTKPISLDQRHVIVVNELLHAENIKQINSALHFGVLRKRVSTEHFYVTDEYSKEKILETLVRRAGLQTYLKSIQDRESLSSTEIGSHMAIPHPLMSADTPETLIYVCVNKRCVPWGKRSVQVVFLLILSEQDTIYYESIFREIYQLMRSDKRIERLVQSKSYEAFVEVLNM